MAEGGVSARDPFATIYRPKTTVRQVVRRTVPGLSPLII